MSATPDRLATALADRYRIERELGQGGMATVYLAEDAKHRRKVAIKVLHPELSAVLGPDRFLKEIELTANLQHPHILPLFDSGAAEGLLYYVMPYVEGESLRSLLTREKQLPIPDALRIASEVAGALDYAHRRGVVHRDIKPENILLHDGRALVADFGIALAVVQAGGSRMTQTGMSLGTPAYMSPEQAMGEREISARSDLYALGCVTYEMLTGEPPFTGPSAQAIVARIMTEEPRTIVSQRNTVPPHVEDAVLTALAKLPADRFATAAEFAGALVVDGKTERRTVGTGVRVSARPSVRTSVLTAALVLASGLGLWGWLRPVPDQRTARFSVTFPETGDIFNLGSDVPAVSPDGGRFVYSAVTGVLFLREENSLRATPIPGSENGWTPAFSPDGGSVAFINGFPGALKIARLAGGAPTILVRDSAWADGLAWSDDGWLYYPARQGTALMRVRAAGGATELVAQADTAKGELFLKWPVALPGGRALLLTVWRKTEAPDVAMLDLGTGQLQVLMSGVRALYAPTGHLVVIQGDGTVVAVPFNPRSGKLSGRPTPVLEALRVPQGGKAFLAFSANGTLLYDASRPVWEVVRVARDGTAEAVDPGWSGEFNNVALSPDGSRLAIGITNQGRDEIWVKTLDTGPITRIAASGSRNARPAWLPDGRSVAFTSDVEASYQLFRAPADGSGGMRPALTFARGVDESEWSRDGRWLVVRGGSGSGRHLYGIQPGVDSQPRPLAHSEFEEFSPSLSPDGRWLAFGSTASGKDEVYVQPFPNTESGKYQISPTGGTEPLWSHSGRELFYRNEKGEFIAVAIAPGPAFRMNGQRVLFSARYYLTDTRNRNYGIGPDDRTFYFIRPKVIPANTYVVVLNWFAELEAKVGK